MKYANLNEVNFTFRIAYNFIIIILSKRNKNWIDWNKVSIGLFLELLLIDA